MPLTEWLMVPRPCRGGDVVKPVVTGTSRRVEDKIGSKVAFGI